MRWSILGHFSENIILGPEELSDVKAQAISQMGESGLLRRQTFTGCEWAAPGAAKLHDGAPREGGK